MNVDANLTAKKFKRLRLAKRYDLVKEKGEFVASRFFESFHVHLYQLEDLYVEMWFRIGLSELCYIELLTNQTTIDLYLENIDLKRDLKL